MPDYEGMEDLYGIVRSGPTVSRVSLPPSASALVGTGIDMRALYRGIGAIVVKHIRGVLGTSEIYTLNPAYRIRKMAGQMFRVPGKAPDQPLILTGGMYRSVAARVTVNGIRAGYLPREATGRFAAYSETFEEGFGAEESGAALAARFEWWNEKTGFVAKGITNAMPEIDQYIERRLNELIQQRMDAMERYAMSGA